MIGGQPITTPIYKSLFKRNPFCAPSPAALPDTDSPWRLAIYDIGLLANKSLYLVWLLWPFASNNPNDELYFKKWGNIVSLARQIFLVFYAFAVLAVMGTFLFLGVFALLPPLAFTLAPVGTLLGLVTWGQMTDPLKYPSKAGKVYPGESWLFVNGICVDSVWLQENCELLASMFGRRVVGIHNRSFGLVFDLVECLLQRDMGYVTDDARQAYASVKSELLREDVNKVVFIAHSQGSIIASMVVDRLLTTLPEDAVRKLEVYTFGSAANHMHDGNGLIRHIEHFANGGDFVSQTGVLAYTPLKQPGNEYRGHLYIDSKAKGHLLNMHYLGNTFKAGKKAMESRLASYLGGKQVQ
ncbi:hypothetical protein BC936DRAFT_148908 [Jimgerdemannia flammicorona]|uniref:DUF676 domain-containing protein n=1 Tax=Jimgerdemannia flammicorona TaxID=994334 RepID=A0A433D222_9FUNG|nr:hypothetical protein BC936DRAFT_148908 [Jimgerdemannia flammicorona]